MSYRAVIFDLGGVVFPSPFDAFDAHEREAGLPHRFIRTVVANSAETGAWARLERSEVDFADFCTEFEAELGVIAGLGAFVRRPVVRECTDPQAARTNNRDGFDHCRSGCEPGGDRAHQRGRIHCPAGRGALGLELGTEPGEVHVGPLESGPRSGLRAIGDHGANEAIGEAGLTFVGVERVERRWKDHASQVEDHGSVRHRGAR